MQSAAERPRGAALGVVILGSISLASAMGIGRFAFTPLFPLMQDSMGMSFEQGTWLAIANYVGYLVGAGSNFYFNPSSGQSAKWSLLVVAVATAAMALPLGFPAWLVLRFASGCASAFVLVGAGAWALAHLTVHEKGHWSGLVFAGVGLGIMAAGVVALAAASYGIGATPAWLGLGLLAAAVSALAWRPLNAEAAIVKPIAIGAGVERESSFSWLLVASYGALGFGYIIPATFIPAAARMIVSDPNIFGWAWPVFGLAAAASTVLTSALLRNTLPRTVAAWSLLVMAVGVAAPALSMSLVTLVISAICVGGTFMVITMAGVQEARRIAPASATRLMAALTSAFAIGQLCGPLLVGRHRASLEAFRAPSLLATALLLCAGCALLATSPTRKRSATDRAQT